jgi:RNA polymerase sigma-70 factor (ECF subfamily)
MNADLSDLLHRIRAGEEAAAEQFVAAYEPRLRLLIRRSLPDRIRSRFDSVDVVQSVWAHVPPGLRAGIWQFLDEARLQAFLHKVARRRLISRVRRHFPAAEREMVGANLDTLPGPLEARPSEVVQAEELWQRMLTLCPASHHELLRLRREGLSLEEIAGRTGLHEGSVRRVLRRLARQLALQQEPLARSSLPQP